MNRQTIKRFTTGEFANHFGIKKDTLYYYDKIKLFCPAEIASNGYRYYTMPQLDTFWAIQALRDLDVPIKELEQYFKAPSSDKLHCLAMQQLNKIEEELKKLSDIKHILDHIVQITDEIKSVPLDTVLFLEVQEEYVLYSDPTEADNDTSAEQWFKNYDSFAEQSGLKGAVSIGSVLSRKDLISGRFSRIDRLYVKSSSPEASLKPAGLYAVLYHKGTYEGLPDTYSFFLKSILEHGYQIESDCYEDYLINSLAEKNDADFISKISVAVK